MNEYLKEQLEKFRLLDEDELIAHGYDFVEVVEQKFGHKEEFIEPLLRLFEDRPNDNFGSPGPLVHYMEAIEGYEEGLLQSLKRKPTVSTLFMTQRILNGKGPTYDLFKTALEDIQGRDDVDQLIKEEIENILEG